VRWLRWSWAELGAATVGEALDLWSPQSAPPDVVESFNRLAGLDVSTLLGVDRLDERVWTELLSFTPRERAVLERRILAPDRPETLSALGEELGITRERVRQVERGIRDKLRGRLEGDQGAPLRHVAARLRRDLGAVTDIGAHDAAHESVVKATSTSIGDLPLRKALLHHASGPYIEIGGLAWSDDARHLTEAEDAMREVSAGDLVEPGLLSGLLAVVDSSQEQEEAVFQYLGLKRIADRIVRWSGSMADKAVGCLAAVDRPLTMLEIHELIGFDRNPRSLAMQVQSDERIIRLGKDRYGLRAWGGEEYSGIMRELEQAIDAAGGSANLEELVAQFVAGFQVSEQSVRAFASDRRFVRTPDGRIGFRTAEDPEPRYRVPPIDTTKGAVRLDGVWHLRLEVDPDGIRGSGRPIRSAIAHALGLEPDLTLGVDYGAAVVTFSWGIQPLMGSILKILQSASCVEGDLVFLPLEGDEPRAVHVVRAAERARESSVRRLAVELGADPEIADAVAPGPLAGLVGLPAGADWTDMRERLEERDEQALAGLVPTSW
jgi:hypothetical protein